MDKVHELILENDLANNSLLRALLSRFPDKIYFKDTRCRFLIASDSLAQLFGVSSSELVGKTDFDFFSTEHAQQAYDDEQTILRNGTPVYREAEKETWPDGRVTWASTIKAPILDDQKKPVGIFGISRDVTKEKEARDALERHDRMLREKNAIMTSDLENARMVQSLLIPGTIRSSDFVRVAVAYEPSHNVSGDVITFPRPDESAFRFFLGDVCGHGVSAGIYTILVKYLADRLSREKKDQPNHILSRMNDALFDVLPNRFVTAIYGIFSQSDEGCVQFEISHAAHPFFFLHRNGHSIETIELSSSSGLGIIPGESYPTARWQLNPGDRLMFFTDGLEEALNQNGEEFGLKRLASLVEESRQTAIEKTPSFLLRRISEFTGKTPKLDDQSCLVFEVV